MNKPKIFFRSFGKWNTFKYKGMNIYFAGCKKTVLNFIKNNNFANNEIIERLNIVNEFFSLIIETQSYILCFSDFCRSFPIFYYHKLNKFYASNDARLIKKKLSLTKLNLKSIDECILSGYTSGKDTLYENLFQNEAFVFLRFDKKNKKLSENKFFYYHKKIRKISKKKALKDLESSIDLSINRLIEKANHRKIIIFMSGGLDSRLILCKLVEKKYHNIIAYSYGPVGNSDSKIAKYVCKKLNVQWEHIVPNKEVYKKFFKNKNVISCFNFSDGLSTLPNFQEFIPVWELSKKYKKTKDYLIVNGQTGDFITGGHIPEKLFLKNAKFDNLIDEILKDHFSLWKNKVNNERFNILVKNLIIKIQSQFNGNNEITNLADLYEIWEYKERQVKFIVQGQRIYDYFGFDWYLPFWDGDFVRFWSKIPLEFRKNKSLYNQFLNSWNFNGLFRDYKPTIKAYDGFPYNLITFLLMGMKIIFGEKIRNRVSKYFDYYSRYGKHYHVFDKIEFLKQRHNFRNPISLYQKKWFEHLKIDSK